MRRIGPKLFVATIVAVVGALGGGAALASAGNLRAASVPAAPAATGATTHNGLEATVSGRRYVAWRVHVPVTGGLNLTSNGGSTDGPGIVLSVVPVGLAGHYGGGGLGSIFLDVRLGGLRLTEGRMAGASSGVQVAPGDYYAVGITSGGTLGLGSLHFSVDGPPGTTELGFTTGPAQQFTDADFIASPFAIPALNGPIVGEIPIQIGHRIVGVMLSGSSTASLGYRDPDGSGHDYAPGGGLGWFGMGPGTYTLRLNETRYNLTAPVIALVADLDLP